MRHPPASEDESCWNSLMWLRGATAQGDRRRRGPGLTGGLGALGDRRLVVEGREELSAGGHGSWPRLEAGGRQVQLAPSKRLVTEPSSKTSLIARARSGAMESTVSLSN